MGAEDMTDHVKEVAIVALAAVLLYALHQGIDGTLLAAGIAAIAGIVGYTVGKKME